MSGDFMNESNLLEAWDALTQLDFWVDFNLWSCPNNGMRRHRASPAPTGWRPTPAACPRAPAASSAPASAAWSPLATCIFDPSCRHRACTRPWAWCGTTATPSTTSGTEPRLQQLRADGRRRQLRGAGVPRAEGRHRLVEDRGVPGRPRLPAVRRRSSRKRAGSTAASGTRSAGAPIAAGRWATVASRPATTCTPPIDEKCGFMHRPRPRWRSGPPSPSPTSARRHRDRSPETVCSPDRAAYDGDIPDIDKFPHWFEPKNSRVQAPECYDANLVDSADTDLDLPTH